MIATRQSPLVRAYNGARNALARSGLFARPTMIHPSRPVQTHGHEDVTKHFTNDAANVGHDPSAFGGWVESNLRSLGPRIPR